jgi:hypothetical protein
MLNRLAILTAAFLAVTTGIGVASAAAYGPATVLVTARIGHNCPPGQIYSTYYHRCLTWNAGVIASRICPPGTRRIAGRCVKVNYGPDRKQEPMPGSAAPPRGRSVRKPAVGQCPAGQRYHPVLKRCVPRLLKPRPSCPDKQVYSQALKRCVPAVSRSGPPRCPAGRHYSPALARCVPDPPKTTARTCPKGFKYDRRQDRCVSVPPGPGARCPSGYYFHHYYHRCLPNQYLSTYGRHCPPGQVRINGRCRRPPAGGPAARRQCPPGQRYHPAANRCVSQRYFPADSGRCPRGYYYHHYYRRCLLEKYRGRYGVHCPPGYQLTAGRCRARAGRPAPACPAGYYYHHFYRLCLPNRYRAAYGLHCPPGRYYDQKSRRCLVRSTGRPQARPVLPVRRAPAGRAACPPGQFFHFSLRRCVPYSYLR